MSEPLSVPSGELLSTAVGEVIEAKRDYFAIWVGIATIVAIGLAGLPGLAALLALRSTNQQASHQLQIAEQGQITDRYNAAITNLGSPAIEVRLGGIYALQRLMQDSHRDQSTVVAVLCAFVRDQARTAIAEPTHTSRRQSSVALGPATDTQAALTVVTTRDPAHDGPHTVVDFSGANLAGADLFLANLTNALLNGANLTGADLTDANLSGADINGAILTGALLNGANLTGAVAILGVHSIGGGAGHLVPTLTVVANLAGAHLVKANLSGAVLSLSNLSGAELTDANLSGAELAFARLPRAKLNGANLTGADLRAVILRHAQLIGANLTDAKLIADLTDANLTDANLTGAHPLVAIFTGANLTGAKWSNNVPAPKGWVRDPISGRLRRAHTGA